MPEGFADPSAPNTRGRRDPHVAAQIAASRQAEQQYEENMPEMAFEPGSEAFIDAGDAQPDDFDGLLQDGDIIMAKRTSEVDIDGNNHYFTFGVQTRVQPDETVIDAYGRVIGLVNQGVVDLAAESEEGIQAENERRLEEARRRPISPRRNR